MEEPPALAERPHVGGYPVPYITAVIDGRPNFKVHDEVARARAAAESLCQMCGKPLCGRIAFCGNKVSVERRTFGEPPAHPECLLYAFEVCPWLAGKPYSSSQTAKARWLVAPQPPGTMGILITDRFWLTDDTQGMTDFVYRAGEPTQPVEWREREQER